ncbi:MAG TPA: hypothetical protein VK771_03165 [Acidimicrobiia bacterium]|nr:hypothetical protein [Acidimicrobiia bacterium]
MAWTPSAVATWSADANAQLTPDTFAADVAVRGCDVVAFVLGPDVVGVVDADGDEELEHADSANALTATATSHCLA